MFESNRHEKCCPHCKKEFYPENSVVHKIVCGDESECSPVKESGKDSDCRVYNFCSESCAGKYFEELPACTYTPGWKKLMGKINKVSSASGIAGRRVHNLHKHCK